MAKKLKGIEVKKIKDWEAEADAALLMQYQRLIDDRERLARALKASKRMQEDLEKNANALKRTLTIHKKKK